MDILLTEPDRPNGTIPRVMLSSDLLPNVLAFVTPSTSIRHQTWLASLALVHRSWRGPVSFALRRHPILTSLSRLLQFQDSLWEFDRVASSTDRHERFPDHFEPILPLASSILSLILDFRPSALWSTQSRKSGIDPYTDSFGFVTQEFRKLQMCKDHLYLDPTFFSSLKNLSSLHLSYIKMSINSIDYLLKTLSPSLRTIGLHDVQFSSQLSQSELTALVFDLVFSVPNLATLHLSGSLAGISGIWSILGVHSLSPSFAGPDWTVPPTTSHEKDSNLNNRSRLCHLILSDGVCSNFLHIAPRELMSRWRSDLALDQNSVEDNSDKCVSIRHQFPQPSHISRYTLYTNEVDWQDPIMQRELIDTAHDLGITLEIFRSNQDIITRCREHK